MESSRVRQRQGSRRSHRLVRTPAATAMAIVMVGLAAGCAPAADGPMSPVAVDGGLVDGTVLDFFRSLQSAGRAPEPVAPPR